MKISILRGMLLTAVVGVSAALVFAGSAHAAPTVLDVSDVVIVSANSDTSYLAGACVSSPESNAVDLLLRVPIGSGTVIKITDNGWNGTGLSNTEGIVTYTAGADLPAGSIIRYSDCAAQTPGSGWVRTGGFDASISGDTLLVYQGAELNPSFIYGFGFRTSSWISSGSISSTSSYIPATLSGAPVPAYITGTSTGRDYQYTVSGSYGIYSATFLTDLRKMSNWQVSGNSGGMGTMYAQTTVPFDASRPTFNTATLLNPAASLTNASSVVFQVTTSEPVQALSTSAFTLATTGTVAYSGAVTAQVNASTYTVTVSGITGTGTVKVSSFADAALTDLRGNPANNKILGSDVYNIDHDSPVITVTTPTKLKNASITDTVVTVIDDTAILAADVVVGTGSSAATSNFSCAQTSSTRVDCTISINNSGDLVIAATDRTGNAATKTEAGYTIDTITPVVTLNNLSLANIANATSYLVSGTCTTADGLVTVSVSGAAPNPQTASCIDGVFAATVDVSGIVDGTGVITVNASQTDAAGNTGTAPAKQAAKDVVAPTVTVNQTSSQADPTSTDSAQFEIVFSESVAELSLDNLTLNGTSGTVTALTKVDSTHYLASVTGMKSGDVVTMTMPSGAVSDLAGNGNTASVSTDNSVAYVYNSSVVKTTTILADTGSPVALFVSIAVILIGAGFIAVRKMV